MGSAPGRWILTATVGGSGMAFLDSTVVNVALPTIGREFGATLSGLQWVVNGYMLTLAALILLAGSLGDRYGRRRVFQLGVVWFAVATAICAASVSLPMLVVARVAQGIGGALLTPGSLAIIEASFRSQDRARAIGAWSGLTGVAAALGPFVGANLVTVTVYAALGAVFFLLVIYLQVALGYSALAAGAAALPVTAVMLLLSARSGQLAQRIGPRPQMSVGPLVVAAGLVLMSRIDPGDGYLTAVLPAVLVLGLGLATTVAPLTSTALAAAPRQYAGLASGVNNTVARTAQLAAVAVVPLAAGLTGDLYAAPAAFAAGFGTAMLITAGLAAAGGVLAVAMIRNPFAEDTSTECYHCGVDGPPLKSCPH